MELMLMPRETELLLRPCTSENETGRLVRAIQARVNRARNEVEVSQNEIRQIRQAKKQWFLGGEKQIGALCDALDRQLML